MRWPDLAEHVPAVAVTDWSNCRHEFFVGRGKTEAGTKRVECMFCGRTFVEGETPKNAPLSMQAIARIAELERAGLGCKLIARAVGISNSAASNYLKKIREVLRNHDHAAAA